MKKLGEKKEKMTKERNKEMAEERLYELHVINQQANALQQQLKILDNNLAELNMIKESLSDLGKSKEKEVFSHLGGGVFVKAELKDKDNVLINVGAGILINKKLKEAEEIVVKQSKETKKIVEKLGVEINSFVEKAGILEKELEGISEEK